MHASLPSERAAVQQQLQSVDERLLRSWLNDCTLHPVVWLILSGLWALAWIMQPEASDTTWALSSLLFLRFVPMFVVVGSLWGRAGTGALVGIGVFFVLMGVESLSLLMWDARLPRSSATLVRHASGVGNALFLIGLAGLLGCGAATFLLRRDRQARSRRFVRRCLEVLAIVQIALLVELTCTSWWLAGGL